VITTGAISPDYRIELPARLIVTGDTHLRQGRSRLPEILLKAIADADLTLHTGDFCTLGCKQQFENAGPVLAVAGNNDDSDLAEILPTHLRIGVAERTILMTHGNLERGPSARVAVERAYAGVEDLVIYGHSHKPEWKEVDGSWFLNPGSPTYKRREPRYSFATLEFDASGNFDTVFTCFDEKD
jgi:uncharacterized protein